MIWLIALAAVIAEARATIAAPVVLRGAQVSVAAQPPRERACDADQPPICKMVVIDLA